MAVLGAEALVLKAALGAAWLSLEGARLVVIGVAYKIALGAVSLAEGGLEAARVMWAGIVATAELWDNLVYGECVRAVCRQQVSELGLMAWYNPSWVIVSDRFSSRAVE